MHTHTCPTYSSLNTLPASFMYPSTTIQSQLLINTLIQFSQPLSIYNYLFALINSISSTTHLKLIKAMLSLKNPAFLSCLLLLSCLLGFVLCDNSVRDKCLQPQVIEKLTNCQDYASAKVDTPTSDCCSSVSDIRTSEPVCLCYIIQQSYDGQLKYNFERLLAIAGACKLANASVADCPTLLNIPSSSPDYAIFTNATTKGTSNSTSTPSASNESKGIMLQISLHATIGIAIISAIFSSIF